MQGDAIARSEPGHTEQPEGGMPHVEAGCLVQREIVLGQGLLAAAPDRWNKHVYARLKKDKPSIVDSFYFLP